MVPVRIFLVGCLVGLAFAGCLDGGDATLSSQDAPLGKKSLRVGSSTLGEFYRISHNSTGHRIAYDYDVEARELVRSVEPFEDHNYIERRLVPNASFHDAFFRPLLGMRQEFRLTDVDPEGSQPAIYSGHLAWDVAGKRVVHQDYAITITRCQNGECTTEARQARDYPRDLAYDDLHWASLDGRILTIGQKLALNRTDEWIGADGQKQGYRAWLNYSVLREAKVQGERVFVLEPSYGFQDLYPEPSSSPTEGSPVPKPGAPKPPKPVHHLYVGSRAAAPVKEEARYPFEFEGAWYWTNWTRTLEVFEPGNETIPWGVGETLPPLDRLPGSTPIPAKDFFTQDGGDFRHGLKAAHDAVRGDVTLTGFQEYLREYPGAMPFRGEYYPARENGAYSWEFIFNDGADHLKAVESRYQAAPAASDVGVVQNREPNARFSGSWGAPDSPLWEKATVVPLGDIHRVFKEHWTRAGDVGAMYAFGRDPQDPGAIRGSVDFFVPVQDARSFGTPASRFEIWRAGESMSFSARDGGLDGLNQTFAAGVHDWPWLPGVPVNSIQELAQMDVPGFPWSGDQAFAHRAPRFQAKTQNG